MYCQNRIMHTVQAGDSLYKLSRQYQTTVTELIMGNPGVNPYNLQAGMRLTICPGPEYEGGGQSEMNPTPSVPSIPLIPTTPSMPSNPNQGGNEAANLTDAMRRAWLSHVYWTRMYLMSVDADAKDQSAVEQRVMQTADEIADVFARVVPLNVTRQLRNLLMEHIEILGEIINALKSGKMENYDTLIKNWYANANQMAALLGNLNPYFAGRETRNMLLNHLDLTREEVEHQINGEYQKSIDTFRDIEQQALEMADFLSRGLFAR